MKKVLVFRHVPHEGLGTIESFLKRSSVQIDYCDLFQNNAIPVNPLDYHFVISMGGPMNVDEIERYPFLGSEKTFIAQAIRSKVPVLGVCLGAQMIARALGARVSLGPQKEIGWYPIQFSKQAVNDPLFYDLFDSKPIVFHWHGDTFDLPVGAALLASSKLFSNQAFQFGTSVYAFQFHLEVTGDMVRDWISKNESEISSLKLAVSKEDIIGGINRCEALLNAFAEKVYGRLFSTLLAKEKIYSGLAEK